MIDIITLAAARKFTSITAEELEEKIKDLSIFQLRGTKATVNELPLTGEVGDVWHVQEDSNEYVWINQHWESFGGLVSGGCSFTDLDLSSNTISNPKKLNNAFEDNIYVVTKSGYIAASNWTSGDALRFQLENNDIVFKSESYTSFFSQGILYTVDNDGTEVSNWTEEGYTTTAKDVNGIIDKNKPLIFTNKAPVFTDQSANPDTGFENYTYRGVISNLTGVTADMLGTVIYSEAQLLSDNYSKTCVTGTNSVTIYSNDNTATIIPTIIVGNPIEVQNSIHSETVDTLWTGTQEEYDALTTKYDETLYFIVEANS